MSDDQQELGFNESTESVAPVEEVIKDDMKPKGNDPLHTMIDANFLTYASYVIRERAIPALADGLKPVQRRILHSLYEKDDGRFTKVANIVGHCMQYHPHGDQSITDALIQLANRGYLIEGQGNFGNIITGDRAAASRYIECRLTELARNEVFNKDITKYTPSYDGRNQEPVVLPTKLPLLLMLGAEGIAVGLSTKVLPHNFKELLEAQIAILNKERFSLLPDFQQGGMMDASEYNKGIGRVRLRACISVKEEGVLAISEIPFGTTTESLIASIEDASRSKKVPVKSIDDFTAEQPNIELTLVPDSNPKKAIQALYAFTSCEIAVSSRPTVIYKDQPLEMTTSEILKENTKLLVGVLKKELQLKKRQLQESIQTKTLVQIFIENRLYKKIEECKTYPDVQKAVADGLAPFAEKFIRPVTNKDLEMLLAIKIKRISRFDIDRNKKDIEGIMAELAKVEKELGNVTAYAIRYLRSILKKYGDQHPRRTEITSFKTVEVRELTSKELSLCYDQKSGYIGHAVKGNSLLECSSYDKVIFVWKDGRYQVTTPPDRMFADKNLIYCAKADRDKVMTVIYTCDHITYMKRFKTGGTILNKEYNCCGDSDVDVQLFSDDDPDSVYVKYKPAKRLRILQQYFNPQDVSVKGAKARGPIMSMKQIEKISFKKPRWWNDDEKTPRGVMMS